MFFKVDPSNGVAIYLQIVRQIKFAIAERALLPSVRMLSQQLTVNPNTVTRAIQELQSEGLVETLRGRGVIVCEGAAQNCRTQRKKLLAERIESVLSEAQHAGLSGDEIRQIVDQKLKSLDGKVTTVGQPPPD